MLIRACMLNRLNTVYYHAVTNLYVTVFDVSIPVCIVSIVCTVSISLTLSACKFSNVSSSPGVWAQFTNMCVIKFC